MNWESTWPRTWPRLWGQEAQRYVLRHLYRYSQISHRLILERTTSLVQGDGTEDDHEKGWSACSFRLAMLRGSFIWPASPASIEYRLVSIRRVARRRGYRQATVPINPFHETFPRGRRTQTTNTTNKAQYEHEERREAPERKGFDFSQKPASSRDRPSPRR